jgi:hypothetical protein
LCRGSGPEEDCVEEHKRVEEEEESKEERTKRERRGGGERQREMDVSERLVPINERIAGREKVSNPESHQELGLVLRGKEGREQQREVLSNDLTRETEVLEEWVGLLEESPRDHETESGVRVRELLDCALRMDGLDELRVLTSQSKRL